MKKQLEKELRLQRLQKRTQRHEKRTERHVLFSKATSDDSDDFDSDSDSIYSEKIKSSLPLANSTLKENADEGKKKILKATAAADRTRGDIIKKQELQPLTDDRPLLVRRKRKKKDYADESYIPQPKHRKQEEQQPGRRTTRSASLLEQQQQQQQQPGRRITRSASVLKIASSGRGLHPPIDLTRKQLHTHGESCSNMLRYWDDPNELVERLRLLVSSASAGHTGHSNEMLAIVEELREANIVK